MLNSNLKTTAIIVAAGDGKRMNSSKNKQFLELGGKPVLVRTLEAFQSADSIDSIIVATKPEFIAHIQTLAEEFGISKIETIVPGGATRQESVMEGILAAKDCKIIAIHDGARPFATTALIDSVVLSAKEHGAAAPGIVPKDTVKVVDESGKVLSTPDRSGLRQIQTPQVFDFESIKNAYILARDTGFCGTDDCSVAENAGISVTIVPGEHTNIKITTAEDLPVAEGILNHLKKQL